MTIHRIALVVGASLSFILCRVGAMAQQAGGNPPAAAGAAASRGGQSGESVQSINDNYNRQLLELERQRLDRLARLAAGQGPKEAAETYEVLFRLAIANNLFGEADPAADRVVKSPDGSSHVVRLLAETINIIAAADRGEYDQSLADLRRLIGTKGQPAAADAPSALLDTPSLLAIFGAYYQRLAQGGRFDVARKAFQLLEQETANPDVRQYCAHRLAQLNLIGKPAPPIRGVDVDGKPFDLAKLQGDVVLVVFWASWCLPNSAEVTWLDEVYNTYRNRGFRIVGINLDSLQNGGIKLETVMPNVRRFLLDHNVRWPNLVNGSGEHDHAAAFGVTEIPSNVLIGRDGTVLQIDLSRKNLAQVIGRSVGRP